MKIAVIITGQLRFRDRNHLINFKEKLEDYDTYISTYTKYKFHASKLTTLDKCIFFRENDIKVSQNNMLQWYHLDSLIQNFSEKLKKYEIIIKLRTDIDFPNIEILKNCEILPDTIYSCTDILFYSTTSHFLKTFTLFWGEILSHYTNSSGTYKSINYRNVINSAGPLEATQEMGARFTWLIVPKLIFSINFNEFKNKIRENMKFLDRLNSNQTRYSDFVNYRFGNTTNIPFSSEQIFCLHCFDLGKLENSKIPIQLYRDRHVFNY